MKIYIAGPYSAQTEKEVERNIAIAIDIAQELWEMGHAPFIPHLYHWWAKQADNRKANGIKIKIPEYRDWLDLDAEWIRASDAVVGTGKLSIGTVADMDTARAAGLPAYRTLKDFKEGIPWTRPQE